MPTGAATPLPGCALCPRLAGFRAENRAAQPDWFNRPVPSFGGLDAALLIVGLAPGRAGANRTGRPFTGDHAGELLYRTLDAFGFSHGHYDARPDDALRLVDCRITNSVRCVPPRNKPEPAEVAACRPFLAAEIAAMTRLRVVLALGAVAHGAVLAALHLKPSRWRFAHGAIHHLDGGRLDSGIVLADSYHCSRYNTNTGRLTAAMFQDVFAAVRRIIAP